MEDDYRNRAGKCPHDKEWYVIAVRDSARTTSGAELGRVSGAEGRDAPFHGLHGVPDRAPPHPQSHSGDRLDAASRRLSGDNILDHSPRPRELDAVPDGCPRLCVHTAVRNAPDTLASDFYYDNCLAVADPGEARVLFGHYRSLLWLRRLGPCGGGKAADRKSTRLTSSP